MFPAEPLAQTVFGSGLSFFLRASLVLAISLAGTAVLTGLVRRYLIKKALFDQPNERSSHAVPTPRGGGLAVAGVILAAFGAFFLGVGMDTPRLYLPLLVGGLGLMVISWIDDRKGLGPGVRLLCHLGAAGLGCWALPDAPLFGGLLPFWLDRVVMVLGWGFFMNIYNFMDGIDGIAGGETFSIAAGVFVVWLSVGGAGAAVDRDWILALLAGGAALGFLVWNWHPAKIFLGDVGSIPLGFLMGFLLLDMALSGYPAAALILPLYYLADGGLTFLKRLLRGEKVWQAHRQHFYQRAALGFGRHDKVVGWMLAGNLLLILLALFAVESPWTALVLAVGVEAGLLLWLQKASLRA